MRYIGARYLMALKMNNVINLSTYRAQKLDKGLIEVKHPNPILWWTIFNETVKSAENTVDNFNNEYKSPK